MTMQTQVDYNNGLATNDLYIKCIDKYLVKGASKFAVIISTQYYIRQNVKTYWYSLDATCNIYSINAVRTLCCLGFKSYDQGKS